jgi:rhodanese-related sulfurtransferase
MDIERLSLGEVKVMMEQKKPITFVDSRNAHDYDESDLQLPGAIRVPVDDVEANLSRIPRENLIISYCT